MNLGRQPARAVAAVVLAGATLAGCVPAGESTNGSGATSTSGCASILDDAIAEVRSGATSSTRLDWLLDDLSSRCRAEYEYFVGEFAGPLRRTEPDPGRDDAPAGSVDWSRAAEHVGRRTMVCGPLVNDGTSKDDVFLNLGLGYPDKDRFTIVIWDVGAVEEVLRGTTLCITGVVTLYDGVAQIETRDPGDVKIRG